MKESFKVFMSGIIDYAGLFPPADLQLDSAIHNYARYRSGDDAWMLSRFIISASGLHELDAYRDEVLSEGEPYEFSVLGAGSETVDEFLKEIDSVREHCLRFGEEHGDRVKTEVLEIRLAKEAALGDDADLVEEILAETARKLDSSEKTPRYVFYEIPLQESWERDLKTVIQAISNHNKASAGENGGYLQAGLKLRCGGTDASMFPSAEQLAFSLNRARDLGVPLKCTAGLHHPVRHYSDSVQTRMHGFFNVFGGALLSHAYGLEDEDLTEIIREEDSEQFVFKDEYFLWNDLSVSADMIREIRNTFLISFGSCSFDEPREDLQKLGLL